MRVPVKGNEQISKLFNDWYQAILQHQNVQATNLKQEVEDKLSSIKEDKNLLLYYSLLDFRYKVLTDGLNITKDSFNEINSFDIPDSSFYPIIITSSKLFTAQFLQTIMKQKNILRRRKTFNVCNE